MADTIKAYSGDQCIAIVARAIPNATKRVLDDVTSAMEVELKHAPDGDPQGALARAVESVKRKMERNAKHKKFEEYLNFMARKNAYDYITQTFPDNPMLGMQARLIGINTEMRGSRLSAAVQQRELFDAYVSGFVGDLDESGLLDMAINAGPETQRAIVTELERIGQEHILPDTGNAEAKKIAEIVHKWQEKARLDANDAGALIGSIPGYIVRQSHDMFRVRDLGRDEWKKIIRDKLDWKRMELESGRLIENPEKFLDELYNSIASGTHMKHVTSAGAKHAAGSQAKSLSHERVLHFKPGEWFDYNAQAGTHSVVSAVMFGLEKNAMTTGLMRAFGPSAEYNMREVYAALKHTNPDKRFKDTTFDNIVAELTGETRIPGNATAARWGSIARGLESITLLGKAVITAGLTDPFLLAGELRHLGANPFAGYALALKSDLSSVRGKERMATARALGVMFQGMAANFHSRLDADGMLSGRMSGIMAKYYKLNLLTPHTDRLRMGAAEYISSMAASYADDAFDNVPTRFRRVMETFGITREDWDMMRRHAVEEHQGNKLMTLEAIERISDSDIRAVHGADISDYKVRQIRKTLASKYHSFLIDRVDTGVLRPGPETQRWTNFGTRPGTMLGETVRSIMHLKSFPIAFISKVLGREIYGYAGSTKMDIAGRLGWTMLQATVLGYGVMVVKDILAGKEPPDITGPEAGNIIREAALKGGGLGFYGDILFGELRKEWGRSTTDALIGPVFGTANDLFDLIGRARDGELETDYAFKTIWRNVTPNLFYLQPVLDYAVLYQAMEAFEPGSVSRMERRFNRQHDREYWLSPSNAVH